MKKFLQCTLWAVILMTNVVAFAQPGDNTGGGGLEGGDPPPAPINSQLLLLVVAGIVFAFIAYQQKRKEI